MDTRHLSRTYAETALVFAVAFALLVAVRAVDPSVHPGGGEKFLDFGILKSLMRAEVLPPQDMWWSGEHILYYYGGHLLAANLAQFTGTEARFAYNLALSGVYATLVTAAYGLAGAIADARGASRRLGGALAAFFVGFASNLVTAVTGAIWLLPDSVARGLANWVGVQLAGHRPDDPDIYSAELVQEGLEAFGYWGPSRVIPHTINEFPLFSFLNGDLHAHMVSTPFLLLVAALGFSYYRSGPGSLRRRRALAFGVLPLVIGLLGLVNVWSFPTGLGVVWLALVFAPADPLSLFPGVATDASAETVADGGDATASGDASASEDANVPAVLFAEARRVAGAFAVTGAVGALAVAWVAPFVFGILLRSTGNRSIEFLPDQSSVVGLLLVHGAFLAVFAAFLWPRARAGFNVEPARFGALAAALVAVAWIVSYPVLVLVVPLLLVGWLMLRSTQSGTSGPVGYETVLMVAGAGLVTLVEFVYVQDSASGGRFNTVFKVYMQVWVLWATAAGAALAALVASNWTSRAGEWSVGLPDWSDDPAQSDDSGRSVAVSRSSVASAFAAVLVVSTALYGAFALDDHFTSQYHRTDDPTLNGKAYIADNHPDEAAAIAWLDDKEGQPTIVSPPGHKVYTWTSPASSMTGLPTVIGWVWHEGIYRGHDDAKARAQKVDRIYTGSWGERVELLQEFDVKYIYVGPRARERYSHEDLEFSKFPGIEVAFEEDGVVVYRVHQSEL